MLLRYAAEHGYTVQEVYIDEDYSGADRRRPAFNQMLAAAERREFDVILAKTQSRFTRDMELVEKYLHGKFAEWGIRFIAVVDHVDTQDRAGKKARQINGLINEWYLEDLSDNVRSVLTHKRWQGDYIATFALYGYRKDPADHSRLLPDPEAAAVVRHIYALYLQGYGTARIAHILNAEVTRPIASQAALIEALSTPKPPRRSTPAMPTPIWPKLIGCWYLTMYHWIPQTSPPLASPARPGIPCGRITPPPKCNFKKTVNFYNKTRQSLHRLRIC